MLDVQINHKNFKTKDGSPFRIINNLAFTVPTGSFTCLVGPSGSGKTTTLRLILGLDSEYDGHVTVLEGARVAAMFQEPRLLPWRTVEQNIRLALPDERSDADLAELLEILDLTALLRFYPGQLSGGLARRVALARAVAVQPSVLLLDEPFISLDNRLASRLRRLLMDVWRDRSMTTLMVTHNLREAIELADDVVVLTPRPATVSGIFHIDAPRPSRDRATVDALLEGLLNRYPCLGVDMDDDSDMKEYLNADRRV